MKWLCLPYLTHGKRELYLKIFLGGTRCICRDKLTSALFSLRAVESILNIAKFCIHVLDFLYNFCYCILTLVNEWLLIVYKFF